jgi:hypothetical protein
MPDQNQPFKTADDTSSEESDRTDVNKAPLHLHEILEGEYISLHGPLPDAYYTDNITDEDRLNAIYRRIHAIPEKRTALCISGGGIRSATFALGIIQGLASAKLLDKFHYLSTVSGGGYIGSWLTSWIHNSDNDPKAVANELSKRPASTTLPEPKPLRHLRDYTSYLSPRLGLLSADTWTLVAVYIRNLLLNWLVLIPLLAGALMAPRLYAAIVRNINTRHFEPTDLSMLVVLVAAALLGAIAIGYIGLNRPSTSKSNRSQTRFLWLCLLPLTVSASLVTIFWAGITGTEGSEFPIWYFLIFGISINLVGFIMWTIAAAGRTTVKKRALELVAVVVAGGVAGWLLWLASSARFLFLEGGEIKLAAYVCFALPLVLAIFILSAMLYVGLISFITDDEDREWLSRSDAWMLIVIFGWCAISALVLYGPIGLGIAQQWVISVGGVSGLISILAGRSPSTKGSDKKAEKPSVVSLIMSKALVIAAPLFIIFSLTLLALADTALMRLFFENHFVDVDLQQIGVDYYRHLETVFRARFWPDVAVAAGLLAVSSLMAFFVNINRFSLHAMYRNRLIRAYLGASNLDPHPNKFTGFDQNDNIAMHKLWPGDMRLPARNGLLHVVNMTLNLVSGSNLAWQERKAVSSTATALHAGSWCLGYRDSKQYGDGISLGTAMAISGAAASPNMGYHSSAVLSFIMTLFNARLGWWLGNPGAAGDKTYRKAGPFWALKPLIAEVFGLTDDHHSYVYLSDGGHFENLALYEMVRRRCHLIVVSDGGCDKKYNFEDLGNAIRKIRIDMGIPIDFQHEIRIFSRSEDDKRNSTGRYCAVGDIKYSNVDGPGTDGYLLYIKPAFYGCEPRDVYEYARNNPDFPHQTTADQFFNESQFESYRALGLYVFEQLSRGWNGGSIADLVRHVSNQLDPVAPDDAAV